MTHKKAKSKSKQAKIRSQGNAQKRQARLRRQKKIKGERRLKGQSEEKAFSKETSEFFDTLSADEHRMIAATLDKSIDAIDESDKQNKIVHIDADRPEFFGPIENFLSMTWEDIDNAEMDSVVNGNVLEAWGWVNEEAGKKDVWRIHYNAPDEGKG